MKWKKKLSQSMVFLKQYLWRMLELPSTAFDIEWNGYSFTASGRGCGHGAGMSQYSANAMADGGKTAKEILEYFYDGCSVK